MASNVVQGVVVTPPLDVRAKNDGFNVLYRLVDLDLPFIYSSVHANSTILRDKPEVVQRVVAAFAEAIFFMEKNPGKGKVAISQAMRVKDEEALRVSYNVYAKEIVDRRMIVPASAVAIQWNLSAHRESTLENRKKSTTTASSIIWKKAAFSKSFGAVSCRG
jgi:ABC-type nitrate/sulfonate/bicarbonate transport system substrate-binding protein